MSIRVFFPKRNEGKNVSRTNIQHQRTLFSIQILLISIVKFTRTDRFSSKYTTGYLEHNNLIPVNFEQAIK